MYNASAELRAKLKESNVITSTGRLTFSDPQLIIEGQKLISIKIKDTCYNNGKIIGTNIAKDVEIEFYNDGYDLQDKEFSLEIGILLDSGKYEYIPYGNFKIDSVTDMKSNKKYKITAMDYMIKLNDVFKDTNTYPMTMKQFLNAFGTQYDIEIEEQVLPNEDFIISEKPYFENCNGRTVLFRMAEMFCRFAKFNRQNKLQFFFKNQTDEKISRNNMNTKLSREKLYGEVNVVTLALGGGVEGENVTLRNEESISTYGENVLLIEDNPFVYTEALRKKAIKAIYDEINGFKYYPITNQYMGRPYLDCGDLIQVQDMDTDEYYDTIVLNNYIVVAALRQSKIENKALTNTEVKYQYVTKNEQKQGQTELIVDKQGKQINGIISEIGDRSQKTTTITADIEGLQSQVSDIEALSKEVRGRTKVVLEDCLQGYIVKLIIKGNDIQINALYPSKTLYPSKALYPRKQKPKGVFAQLLPSDDLLPDDNLLPYGGDSQISVTNENGKSVIYDLGIDYSLKAVGDVCDEYILENNKAKIIRRIDENWTVKDSPVEEDLGELIISLEEGNNTIQVMDDIADMEVTYVPKNNYTDVFATKKEMESKIEQSAEAVEIGVNKKLENYSTTAETNATIKVTADEINGEVAKKVNKTEVVSSINASAEQIQINSNKISLAGKQIDMTADDISIDSTNFKVDKNGNMECNSAKITGGDIYLANNSKIIGGQGLLNTFIFSNDYSEIGYKDTGGTSQSFSAVLEAYIPSDVTIVKATIYVDVASRYLTGYQTLAGISNGYYTVKQLKLYKQSGSIGAFLNYPFAGEASFVTQNFTEITEFDSWSPTASSISQSKSVDITSRIETGKRNMIEAKTTKSFVDNDQYTNGGMCKMTLVVVGYRNYT